MPIYEYQCEACGHILETLQKVSEAPLTKCPECGKETLKKLISASAFRLKGGGWYADGYGSGGKSENKGSETKAESKSGGVKQEGSQQDLASVLGNLCLRSADDPTHDQDHEDDRN